MKMSLEKQLLIGLVAAIVLFVLLVIGIRGDIEEFQSEWNEKRQEECDTMLRVAMSASDSLAIYREHRHCARS